MDVNSTLRFSYRRTGKPTNIVSFNTRAQQIVPYARSSGTASRTGSASGSTTQDRGASGYPLERVDVSKWR